MWSDYLVVITNYLLDTLRQDSYASMDQQHKALNLSRSTTKVDHQIAIRVCFHAMMKANNTSKELLSTINITN